MLLFWAEYLPTLKEFRCHHHHFALPFSSSFSVSSPYSSELLLFLLLLFYDGVHQSGRQCIWVRLLVLVPTSKETLQETISRLWAYSLISGNCGVLHPDNVRRFLLVL